MILGYWRFREFAKWYGKAFAIQCSGKREVGHALEYCQLRLGHDGVCVAWDGDHFSKPYQP